MAFVYEKLTEKDKDFFRSFGLRNPLSSFSPAKVPDSWVADRENKIFLVCLGGQGYRFNREFPPTWFYLIWDKNLVKIQVYDKVTGNWNMGIKAIWEIDRIVISDELMQKVSSELLVKTIKEAFEVYESERSKKLLSIDFIKVATPIFVKGDVENG